MPKLRGIWIIVVLAAIGIFLFAIINLFALIENAKNAKLYKAVVQGNTELTAHLSIVVRM